MRKLQSLRSNYLQVSILFILCGLIIVPRNRILARFPWQDLIYNDFQIYKQWQFFSSSVKSDGIIHALLATHNFGLNMGENIYVISRVSPAIFDLGAWIFLATNNLDIATMGKLSVYFINCFIGFKKLYDMAYPKASRKRDFFFIVSLVTVLSHPALYHEVGPMVLWYLLLTPTWLYFFLYAQKLGLKSVLKNNLFYVLIFITIGSSDLFIFFYFPFIALVAFFLLKFKESFFSLFKFLTLIELLILIPKIPYIYFLLSNENNSRKGSFGMEFYFSSFIVPLLKHSILFIYFTGPVLIFLNFVLLVSMVYLGLHNRRVSTKYVVFLGYLLALLISLGLLVHGIPFVRDHLPSAFRYHVALWPFIVACILPFWSSEIVSRSKQKVEYNSLSNFAFLFVLTILISNSSVIYQNISPIGSKKIIDTDMRSWLLQELPDCINKKTQGPARDKSFIFMTPDSESGRNDALMFLEENPSRLNGRTFNQWSYATNNANYYLNMEHDLLGLNSWAFTDKKLAQATDFATEAHVSYLLSTTSINPENPRFVELGSCKIPEKLQLNATPFRSRMDNQPLGNLSLASTIYIYNIDTKAENSPIKIQSIDMSSITFKVKCNSTNQIVLPVSYSRALEVTHSKERIQISKSTYSKVALENINERCGLQHKISVKVESQSKILYTNMIYFLVLTLMMITRSNFFSKGKR
jgi:hypothetical protein